MPGPGAIWWVTLPCMCKYLHSLVHYQAVAKQSSGDMQIREALGGRSTWLDDTLHLRVVLWHPNIIAVFTP